MANKTFSDFVAGVPQASVQPGDLIPVVQGGVSKKAPAGQAGGPALLDAAGMVLDASGVKIVEYGSNANGEYVRFADGTQICLRTDTVSSPTTSSTSAFGGTAYYHLYSWTYPAAFIAAPTVVATEKVLELLPEGTKINTVSTTYVNVYVWSANDFSGSGYIIHLIAIGRWK